jgi:hypothetical protein
VAGSTAGPTSEEIRARLVDTFRRDLVGPGPNDSDIARERLPENPSRWYLTGFLAPVEDEPDEADPSVQEEMEIGGEAPTIEGTAGASGDDEPEEAPAARKRFLPSSIGLTVLLPLDVAELGVTVSWGDYLTEPPLPEAVLFPPEEATPPKGTEPDRVDWIRVPRESRFSIPIVDGRSPRIPVPDSAQTHGSGGGLAIETHGRCFSFETPDGRADVRAVTVFLVNRRCAPTRRRFSDVAYAFQARLELHCPSGFQPRHDLSGYNAADEDLRVADLHYRDVEEFAVGRNVAAAWVAEPGGKATRVWSEPLPLAEVERVAPNEAIADVEFGMEALADLAEGTPQQLSAALAPLAVQYAAWIAAQAGPLKGLATRRRETGVRLLADMETARARIAAGIDLLETDDRARLAFRIMNLAIAKAARRRNAGATGDPASQPKPKWRPFQLAFILLNLAGLVDKRHADRETVDLLFFPTGGGKTEAYLGLAAFAIVHRRLAASGVLGAGVTVIMRYTLRLLTLDQLSRAAGVICALELMRGDPAFADKSGKKRLGDWPIEIGLWVGSDASPNRMGGQGDTGDDTAVTRVRQFKNKGGKAPAPIKACPWCGTEFGRDSFLCVPNVITPLNLEVRCVNPSCDFTGNRALPVLTVDEPIYRRLPSFLIATVDKFAALPWVGETGAFFGHVDRADASGFYGAAEPKVGTKLYSDWRLDPPDLVIQDELHLISGPLGTVAGLYEAAIDQLATRHIGDQRIRPKIVASTATVRRASTQILALFDRSRTAMFPPAGINRVDSFFAQTVPVEESAGRWYLGIAAQGRGPKLVFLRTLTTLLAAAQAEFLTGASGGPNPADPYMTALCYFNALRELGGARRIVEDEVRDRVGRYGKERRRIVPADSPFADRKLGLPMELTSRVSTDAVAEAKRGLETVFGDGGDTVDVALATNMISVGLDISRLGLMLVQGQPKTAAEYIQATSRVGRHIERPGLVVAVLNMHKPRDRMHFEQFGQFHRTFYRAVEATSVTPWAARALDRALAAIVVALLRHSDPDLTPETAVRKLRNHPDTRSMIRDVIVNRAPDAAIPGGRAALAAAIDELMSDWMKVTDDLTSNGGEVSYTRSGSKHPLLHMPLDPALPNLPAEHRRFVAGRSMRDVEPNVMLKIKDPYGQPIANAQDLS